LIDILDCGVRPLNFVIFSSLSVPPALILASRFSRRIRACRCAAVSSPASAILNECRCGRSGAETRSRCCVLVFRWLLYRDKISFSAVSYQSSENLGSAALISTDKFLFAEGDGPDAQCPVQAKSLAKIIKLTGLEAEIQGVGQPSWRGFSGGSGCMEDPLKSYPQF
jgi:hypothetical protein